MIVDAYGQFIYNQDEICDVIMQGNSIENTFLVDESCNFDVNHINDYTKLNTLVHAVDKLSVGDFDTNNQKNWFMPLEYKDMDIAEYILSLCDSNDELQRCGHELIMYQERNLFNLLKYMKYLVDTMIDNNIVWGVGRGSSVSSFVLFKLKVHKINSMYYNLDVSEFLR
jgi:DNA polymerase III alpha subunit